MNSERDKKETLSAIGYSVIGGRRGQKPAVWCQQEGHNKDGPRIPPYLKALEPNHLVLFCRDTLMAVAHENSLVVLRIKDITEKNNVKKDNELEPVAVHKTSTRITHIVARGTRKPFEILAALDDGSIWSFDFESSTSAEPRSRLIAENIKSQIKAIISTRSRILVLTHSSSNKGHKLLELEPRAARVQRIAELPFSTVVSLTPLDTDRADTLVVIDGARVAHLITLSASTNSSIPKVTELEVPHISAVTMFNRRYLVVAQKGGLVTKVNIASAALLSTTTHNDVLARVCRLICTLLRVCQCTRPCECPDSDVRPTPDGGGEVPPGGFADDEPCNERQVAQLQWTARAVLAVGPHLVAFSQANQRMAVLDRNLNILFERYLGAQGAIVATGQISTDRMLLYRRDMQSLEAWSLSDYVRHLRGFDPRDIALRPPLPLSQKKSVTYYGQKRSRALPNPEYQILVFTVTEPGQAYTDPDQSKLIDQIEPNVFDIVTDYYDEASFGEVDVQFTVFGADIGGTRRPLVLPQPVADYFRDDFTPGGVEAVMPADWANPLVLDGTESVTIRSNPRVGDSKEYPIPFAALWTSQVHATYPVDVHFDGTETLEIIVEDQEGNAHILNLAFEALIISHEEGDDEDAFLETIGNHVTSAIRAAEEALPVSPTTFQDVVFRRIRTSDDDSVFGRLQGQFRVVPAAPADVTQKGTISITPPPSPAPDGIVALGLSRLSNWNGVLADRWHTELYLTECLDAAQSDAGEGLGLDDAHFVTHPDVTEDVLAMELTVRINLSDLKGGQGATLEVIDHNGMDGSGWDAATSVPGSESNRNNQNNLRDHQQLADDVFTAALDHIRATSAWDADTARALFADFDIMMIGFVGEPPVSVPAADRWGSTDPANFSRLRMFRRTHFATDQNNPNPDEPPVAMPTNVIIGQKFNAFDPGTMAHELGHGLGLNDLYYQAGYRDDVRYMTPWAMMGGSPYSVFTHFCGFSKLKLGWITEDPDDEAFNRIVDVPLPEPSDTPPVEAWLVPVEHWDENMKDDVRAVVGGALPIAQLMRVHLGSDGGVVNLIELRAPGITYSQNLPPSPAVICTNVLHPENDRRWAVNGLYRRDAHLLNNGNELMNVGDKWDFSAGVEFPLKGCTVEVMNIQNIRGGTIPVFHLKVEREDAAFIDLHFQDHAPSWRSPDLWIDWPGDNPDPTEHREYPEGTPTDQGETVRYPDTGVEPHFMVARVHNAGRVRAEDIKVRWFICDPPGAGDDGRWVEKDTKTIPEVPLENWETLPFTWNVDPATSVHQCLRAEIIDWTIPAEVDPATGDTLHLASDDVLLQNNAAQQNVFDFEALSGSSFEPIAFEFQVHNDYVEAELASLVPNSLPWGMTLEVSPAEAKIEPAQSAIFRCKLTLNPQIIQPGCTNDQGFLLTAWRRAEDSDEKWGSCFYFVRPRYKTKVNIMRGYWEAYRLFVVGEWLLTTDEEVDLSDQLPRFVRVRIEIEDADKDVRVLWRQVAVQENGLFRLEIPDLEARDPAEATIQVWFDRTDLLGSSVSLPIVINHRGLI